MNKFQTDPFFRGPEVASHIKDIRSLHERLRDGVSWEVRPGEDERNRRARDTAIQVAVTAVQNGPKLVTDLQADMEWIAGLPDDFAPVNIGQALAMSGLPSSEQQIAADRIMIAGGVASAAKVAKSAEGGCPAERARIEAFVAFLQSNVGVDAKAGKVGEGLSWSQETMSNASLAVLIAGVKTKQHDMMQGGAAAGDFYEDQVPPS